jgi:hypothetical protein
MKIAEEAKSRPKSSTPGGYGYECSDEEGKKNLGQGKKLRVKPGLVQ